MAGTRYGHKIRGRLNGGYQKMAKEKYNYNSDRHYNAKEGEADLETLAEIFFCTKEKIRLAVKMGIIKPSRTHVRMFFNKQETVQVLQPYVKNGILTLKK